MLSANVINASEKTWKTAPVETVNVCGPVVNIVIEKNYWKEQAQEPLFYFAILFQTTASTFILLHINYGL